MRTWRRNRESAGLEAELRANRPEPSRELLSKLEGIIPALESAHGLAQVMKLAPTMDRDQSIVLCLSGRGDKDLALLAEGNGVEAV